MTDEFNLVPTNNLEKHLDNILRAASGEEPQYDLTPNWRVEQYLAAIAQQLSGGGSGGSRFVVTFSYDEATETWNADKTIAECVAAWNAGQTLFAYNSALACYIPMSFYNSDDVYMAFVAVDGETKTAAGFGIDAEGAYGY